MAKENSADVKAFVEKLDGLKKLNPKDLSSDQDLSIAIMNLISIEEHLAFTGAKTGKTSYYDLISEIRTMRKNLLQRIIKKYEGEVWCTSKHLLAASMRLMEVATKQQDLGNGKDAYSLFDQAYELYCLFWGLNMNAINLSDVSWAKDVGMGVEEIRKHVANSAAVPADSKSAPARKGAFSGLKELVRKAVNCCIE